jgi:hypothetical protein
MPENGDLTLMNLRALLPLYETEIRGIPMLKQLGDAMFA